MARFHQFGYLGTVLGFSLWVFLARERHLPLWVTGAMFGTFILVLFSLAMFTKIVIGHERLVYYHHEIAVLTATAAMLKLVGAPVLAFIDIAVLGLGVFLGCGRIGCWMSGCCYGKPNRWGLPYAAPGQPPYGAGVRLYPVPLIESAWAFATVLVGIGIALRSKPGDALAWYTVVYGLGRFGFEFLRGDPDRPYWKGVSEAQWTSWVLITLAAVGELAGILAFHMWHVVAAGALTAVILGLILSESTTRALLRPRHLCQLAEALETARSLTESTGEIHVGRTSLGLQVSASPVDDGGNQFELVAFSRAGEALPGRTAARLASVIVELSVGQAFCHFPIRPVSTPRNTYHLILPARSPHAL